MLWRALVVLVFLVPALGAYAVILDPPSLRCATVNIAGDVTLTWVVPADPGGDFQEYRIYGSGAEDGPYLQVGTVPAYAQNNFFHAGAGALGGPRYYYVTALSSAPPPNESMASDTLVTLFLTVNQSAPLGNAVLSWNSPTLLSTTSPEISIWMEYPLGNWTLLADIPSSTTSYVHAVSVCSAELNFRVGLADAQGCVSYSSRDGDVFEDVTPPTSPTMTVVSVDTLTGLSNLYWDPSPEGDTDGYIIVLNTPGGGVIIDTVFGQMNTSYEWPLSTAGQGPESFTIAAFDTCQVGEPPGPNTSATRPPHTTMHLTTGYDRCAALIVLQWSPYVGWDVSSYQILMQVDGGAWNALTNVAGDQTTFSYSVEPGQYYCFLVKAIRGTGLPVAFSNETCRQAEYPALPQFNYVRSVTVTAPEEIMIVDSVDMSAEVSAYTLERSASGGPWSPIATVGGEAGPLITFFDDDVEPSRIAYRYRVQVVDSCGGGGFTSNIGGNIVLQATPDLSNYNRLIWNGYEAWAGAPVAYNIFRSIDSGPFDLIGTTPPQPLSFDDNVQAMLETTGRFCYQVQAVEAGNPSGINATSESNIQCAVQEELVYIPNAFVVGGVNRIFIPVIGYVDVAEYEFSIMNRWGQVIWTTNDRAQGWDGTLDSKVMPTGIYAYYCSFHNGHGRRFEKRGIVTLLTAIGE